MALMLDLDGLGCLVESVVEVPKGGTEVNVEVPAEDGARDEGSPSPRCSGIGGGVSQNGPNIFNSMSLALLPSCSRQ